jgi:hypothetical protein
MSKDSAPTDGAERLTITDVRELMPLIELQSVVFNEVSAKRTSDEDEPDQFRMDVSSRLTDDEIAVLCRATVHGAGGVYVAEAVGTFPLAQPVAIEHSIVVEFVERVGVMAVYPYLRTALSDGAVRIGRRAPVLRLLRPGGVKLQPPETGKTVEERSQ